MTRLESLQQWLLHRLGQKILDGEWPRLKTFAAELNKKFPDVKRTYGKKNFLSLIGFVDIINYSERVKGLPSIAIAKYLMTFLNNVTCIVIRNGGLIDKTIGDEVMFFMPDEQEEGGVPLISKSHKVISSLIDLKTNLGSEYPYRMGLAIGDVYLDQIVCEGYSEWSIFGESVNFAKRLTSNSHNKGEAIGVIGALESEAKSIKCFEQLFKYMNINYRDNPRMIKGDSDKPLNGIGKYKCALLFNK